MKLRSYGSHTAVSKLMCIIFGVSLDLGDTLDVLEELAPIRKKTSNIGLALGLSLDSFDSEPTLESVVDTWLSHSYDTECHEEPTYRRLVKAVANQVGGSNPALAKNIAMKHPGN